MAKFLDFVNGRLRSKEAITSSAGAADANKLVATASGGKLDPSLLPASGGGAAFATVAADHQLLPSDGYLLFTHTGSVTLTIPSHATVPFPAGAEFRLSVTSGAVLISTAAALVGFSDLPSLALLQGLDYRLLNVGADSWQLRAESLSAARLLFSATEFLAGAVVPDWLATTTGGSGANTTTVSNTVSGSDPGAVALSPGTTATGFRLLSTASNAIRTATGAPILLAAKVALQLAPTAAENFATRVGLINGTAGDATGAYFRLLQGVNGEQWSAVCRNGASETVVPTSAAATAYARLEVLLLPGSYAIYWIDGVEVARITTNLPPSSTSINAIVSIGKLAGTTARLLYLNKIQLLLGLG